MVMGEGEEELYIQRAPVRAELICQPEPGISQVRREDHGDFVELRTWEGMSPTGWAHKSEAKGGTKRGRRVAGVWGPQSSDP
jgi:hypothetical protein